MGSTCGSSNSLYGLMRETVVCCCNNNNVIHRERRRNRVTRGSINVINGSSNQMHAVDYVTYKKNKIINFLQTNMKKKSNN